jgi:hypothetical protein
MITANLPILNLGLQYLDQGIFMSDLISNPATISQSVKSSGPRESQTTQASEAQASSQAQETQSIQSAFATLVYNHEREGNTSYKGDSKKDKFANKEWTIHTNAVLAA